ncbi:MAG: PEP-CTERM sorting domain-containing protein, partial [Planctomycetia bacterium]|nr:PEP-CTERM sorting domain-containing protein [Planctomycetia bacterium]
FLQDIVNAPGFWTQKTLSFPTDIQVKSYLQPTPKVIASVSAVGYKDTATLNAFSGNGVVQMPIYASATSSYSNSSGNGAGGSVTTASAALSVTYYYNLVPEPSGVALMGLGTLGLCLFTGVRSRRRSRAAA